MLSRYSTKHLQSGDIFMCKRMQSEVKFQKTNVNLSLINKDELEDLISVY